MKEIFLPLRGLLTPIEKKIEINVSNISLYSPSIYDIYGFDSDSMVSKINCDLDSVWRETVLFLNKTGVNAKFLKRLYSDFKKEVYSMPYDIELDNQIEGTYLNNLFK